MLAPGVALMRLEDLPEGGAIAVEIDRGGERVALILTRVGGSVAAFRNRCPHAGYPLQLANGRVLVQEGLYIVCGAHGASYRLDDGGCAGGPCNGEGLERVAVTVSDGLVTTS